MTYATEFPEMANDTACATLAGRPDDWEDTSWGNDQCPSFTCDVFVVWCQPENAADREFPDMKRFGITDEGRSVLETDDFAEVLAFIDDGKRDFEVAASTEATGKPMQQHPLTEAIRGVVVAGERYLAADALTATPARYLAAAEDGHLGRDIEGAEKAGFHAFFNGNRQPTLTAQQVKDWDHGYSRGWAVAFAQGAIASLRDGIFDVTHGEDRQTVCPYPEFSPAWEAWADGYNDHSCGALEVDVQAEQSHG